MYNRMLFRAFILTLSSFSILGFSSASDECKRLKHLNYELFGTKTIYEDARRYLARKDDLPKSFDDDTLEEEHEDLVKNSCKPVVFYFIGRHSARFPDSEDIEFYNRKLSELKDFMKQQESTGKCGDKFRPLLDWVTKMQPKHDNLITHLGGMEERNISRRFKQIYPEFFDVNKADIDIGVTSKIRTAQTGVEFLKEVDGLKIDECDLDNLPTNDAYQPNYDLDKILENPCYKSLLKNKSKEMLEFHKTCEKIGGRQKSKHPLVERIKKPEVIEGIAENVARRLGLPKESRSVVNEGALKSIYNMCKFENALKDDSVWCPLFSEKDVKALEYIDDVNTYLKDAYGPKANVRQSCPLVKHLVEAFQDGLKLNGSDTEKRKAYFYFSHAEVMKKLFAAFEMFKDDENFSEDKIKDFVRELKVPKDREWRASVISPFSANMAFVLYRCAKPGKQVKHKVLATVTERPVKLGGCRDTKCSSDKFFSAYDNLRDCDLNKICAKAN